MYINSAKGTWSTSFDWASFCFRLCHQQYFKQRVGFSSVVSLHQMHYMISPFPSPSFPASLFPPDITEKLVWLKGIIWCHSLSWHPLCIGDRLLKIDSLLDTWHQWKKKEFYLKKLLHTTTDLSWQPLCIGDRLLKTDTSPMVTSTAGLSQTVQMAGTGSSLLQWGHWCC